MIRNLFALLLIGLIGSVVAQEKPTSRPAEPTSRPVQPKDRKLGLAKPIVFEPDREVYGAKLKGLDAVPLPKVVAERATFSGKNIQLRGRITSVCPKKGCWMTVVDGKETVRVKFRDYAFFVPLDAAGRDVTVEGTIEVKVETEAERRHYAEDAGQSPEQIAKITGDQTTLSVMADAVQIGTFPPAKVKPAPKAHDHDHDHDRGAEPKKD
jgi:hypothetical protein